MEENIFSEYYPYVFLVAGIIFIAFSIFWESKNSNLKQTGICVEGIIFDQDIEQSFKWGLDTSNNYTSVKDKITIRFLTKKQEWITGTIAQGFRLFYNGQYKDGEKINVYYDLHNPSNFYVDTKQSETTGRLISGLVGLLFFIIGLYQLFI